MATNLPTKSFQVPYQDALIDARQMLTQSWQWFFRNLWDRVYPLGTESSFVLANNQTTPADITGLAFNFQGVTQAFVDYIIQRITTSTGATELVEAGCFILSYRPSTSEWRLTPVEMGAPDSSGVSLMVTPQPFTATYDHTTSTWTRANFALVNGSAVKLQAGTSLPTGYALNTTYFVINAAAGTFKLAHNIGGSVVAATSNDGTGTLTVIPAHAADGQVQYISSNISGTASISSIFWRARTIGGKSSVFSVIGKH